MKKALFGVFSAFLKLVARLPFFAIYVLSDFLYLIIYKLIKYRLKVVRLNLTNSFPEKNEIERLELEKRFYHHFCDTIVETLKLFHISEKEMKQHVVYKNIDVIDDVIAVQDGCLVMLGHYGNWEWAASSALYISREATVMQLYRKLKNKNFDRMMLVLRQQFGAICVEKDSAFRSILTCRKKNKKVVAGFIADQTPSVRNIHYWTTFLNQDTPVLDGAERIARPLAYGMVYFDVKKVKRGYYEIDVIPMTKNVAKTSEFEMTELYMRMMEKTILREPAYYLWSHRRWKYKKPQNIGS